MVLSDKDIVAEIADGNLVIDPYRADNVEPASIDLRLGEDFKRLENQYERPIKLDDGDRQFRPIGTKGEVIISPDDFVLATTLERVEIPDNLVGSVLGRSSLGRLGISVHQTAGYIDPGFKGEITLELSNHGPAPVKLEAGDRICQIVFERLSSPAEEPYGHEDSQYQNQSGATPSGMSFD